jgi:hypothetical protein
MRPPNRLQNETNIVPASFVLTNDRDDQSFNTAIEERSLPSLSSAPQGDNQ